MNSILIEQCPVPLVILEDQNLVIKGANTKFISSMGCDRSIIGQPLIEAIPGLSKTDLADKLNSVLNGGAGFEEKDIQIIIACDGDSRGITFDLSCSPEVVNSTAAGLIVAITNCRHQPVFGDDYTNRDDWFKKMVMQAPVSIAVYRGENLIVDVVNESWVQVSGKSKDVVGKPLIEALPEFNTQPYPEILREVLRTGQRRYGYDQLVYLQRNGTQEEAFFNYVYAPLNDAEGRTTHVIAVTNEVTQPVALKKQLEVSEERLNLAIEAAGMGTWDIDLSNGDLYCSEQSKLLWGLERDDEFSVDAAMAGVVKEDLERVERAMEKAIHDGGKYQAEFRVLGKDGKERWIRGTGKVFLMADGSPKRFIGTNLDITQSKTEELRKNDFIGIVSHELKTPLSGIKSYHQILKKKLTPLEDGFFTNTLARTDLLIQKMTALINGFLDISQLEAGKLKLRKSTFDMADLIGDVMIDARNLSPHHHFDWSACPSVLVFADKHKIEQVITNLINNAAKYSPNGTTITLRCEIVEGFAQLSVKDQGPGISLNDQPHLFKRFYRVSNTQHSTVSGFGIGLYLASEIMNLHQGKIWLESEVGKGSTFFISLPVV